MSDTGSADHEAIVTTEDRRPHSRACGIRKHEHGPDCHSNCPTCGGNVVTEEQPQVVSRVKPSYLPDFGPDDCLWLVTVLGEWPVHAHASESSAIHHVNWLRQKVNDSLERDNRVRVTKVTIATYEELAFQVEVVRQTLVPKGTAVKS